MRSRPAPVGERDALRVARRQPRWCASVCGLPNARPPRANAIRKRWRWPRPAVSTHATATSPPWTASAGPWSSPATSWAPPTRRTRPRGLGSCRTARSAGRACGSAWPRGARGRGPRCGRRRGAAASRRPRRRGSRAARSSRRRAASRGGRGAGSPVFQLSSALPPGPDTRPGAVRKPAGGLASRGADHGGAAAAAGTATSSVTVARRMARTNGTTFTAPTRCGATACWTRAADGGTVLGAVPWQHSAGPEGLLRARSGKASACGLAARDCRNGSHASAAEHAPRQEAAYAKIHLEAPRRGASSFR